MVENPRKDDPMTATLDYAAARHLVGLTQREFGERIGVSGDAVRDWESGKHTPAPKSRDAIALLVQQHNVETARLRSQISDCYTSGGPVVHPPVIRIEPRAGFPRGWYVALAARLYDGVPVSVELD